MNTTTKPAIHIYILKESTGGTYWAQVTGSTYYGWKAARAALARYEAKGIRAEAHYAR